MTKIEQAVDQQYLPYLSAMGLSMWQLRDQRPSILPNVQLQHFLLKNSDHVTVAGLIIDPIEPGESEAMTLLEAMLSAIHLMHQLIQQDNEQLQMYHISSVLIYLLMGKTTVQQLLQVDHDDQSLRQCCHPLKNSQQAIITDHPSVLLKYPQKKRQAWRDLKYFLRMLEN